MGTEPSHDPKKFISEVLIIEMGEIAKTNAYLSFVLISIAIEFLGKCIDDTAKKWTSENPKGHFNLAIQELMPKYEHHNLYVLLRCGLAHYLAPQKKLSLSSHNSKSHLTTNSKGTLTLNIEDFYGDFKIACELVITGIDNKTYKSKKIYRPFLFVHSNNS